VKFIQYTPLIGDQTCAPMTDGPTGPVFIPRLSPDSALTGTEGDVMSSVSKAQRDRARDANTSTGRERRQSSERSRLLPLSLRFQVSYPPQMFSWNSLKVSCWHTGRVCCCTIKVNGSDRLVLRELD